MTKPRPCCFGLGFARVPGDPNNAEAPLGIRPGTDSSFRATPIPNRDGHQSRLLSAGLSSRLNGVEAFETQAESIPEIGRFQAALGRGRDASPDPNAAKSSLRLGFGSRVRAKPPDSPPKQAVRYFDQACANRAPFRWA